MNTSENAPRTRGSVTKAASSTAPGSGAPGVVAGEAPGEVAGEAPGVVAGEAPGEVAGGAPGAAAGGAAGGLANRAVSTSVSEVATSSGQRPLPSGSPSAPAAPARAAATIAASSSVLMRLPLWPSATAAVGVDLNVGWALCHTEEPVVEYRQWPTAMCPRSVLSTDSSNTWATRPMSLYTTIRLPSLTAMRADSWPLCCSAYRP